jgi:hypothetical protein
MPYDLFISYAHQGDNTSREAVAALVAMLHAELEADFRRRFNRDLEIFFDKEDIQDFDHWQVRCHRALRDSRFFIACLSRTYLRSDACRWEWEEWCGHELEHGLVGQGAASLWFVKLEDLDAPEDAELLRRWKGDLLQRFHIQCYEWRHDDRDNFLNAAARSELQQLTEHVAQRLRLLTLDRARRGNLPWPNANFVGRETELANLRAALLEASERSLVGIHGVGGMGKTALAQAFAYKEADAFPGGCWLLRCEGRDQLLTVFRTLVTELEIELTDEEKLDDARAVRRVFDVLRARGQALFLLDNVDHPALLAQEQIKLLADQLWARAIYTTRLAPDDFSKTGATIRPLDLDRLPENQAVDLIRRYQPEQAFASPEHEAAAREIVRELSGLTLAVETAAVYLGQGDLRVAEPQYAVDVRNYLNKLREDLKAGGSEGVISQLREVTTTLRPTLARLDAPTRTVLQIASLLAPDGVALPWVRTIAGQSHPELSTDAATGQSDTWTQLIRGLIGMRLFHPTAEPRVMTIHRILQRALEVELSEGREQLQAQLDEHVLGRNAALEKKTNWREEQWELEPLGTLAELWADSRHSGAAWLLRQAGGHWYRLAEWSRAEPLARRALAIDEAKFGTVDPNVATYLNNLAVLLRETNRLAEAELLMRRALAIGEQFVGANHPNVATELSNLAQLLQYTNRVAEAEPLMRRALAIDEAKFGADHPNVATQLNNLAQLLQDTNRLMEAEPLMRRVLAIDEARFGADHPKVARDLNNLAELLQATNRLAEAELLMRRALAINEASFGVDHFNIAGDLNNLAQLLQLRKANNWLLEAESLQRRALDILKKSLGTNHPQVAACLNNLAHLLQATNRLAEAEPLMQRALAIDEASFGANHPAVARDLNNLASLYCVTNRLTAAEPLMRRALAIDEAAFGSDHPNVAGSLNNLAHLLQATNQLVAAEPLRRRALSIWEKSLVQYHPDTLTGRTNLANLLDAMGKKEEAQALNRTNLDVQERTLGFDHPDTLRGWNNLSYIQRKDGRADLAEPTDRRLAEATARIMGATHPLSVHRKNNLVLSLILLDKLPEARIVLHQNWHLKAEPFANTIPRIAFLREVIALLEPLSDTPFLGQIKTFLTSPELPVSGDVAVPWDIVYFIEFLKPKLGVHNGEFLTALVAALNDRTRLSALDQFPEWRNQPAVPLETPWPDV